MGRLRSPRRKAARQGGSAKAAVEVLRVLWAFLVAPRKWFVLVVRAYQKLISPWTRPSCRFVPTCSEYAVEALEKYGVVRGIAKSVWRVARCHPFHPGGYDPP